MNNINENIARKFYYGNFAAHSWDHIERVHKLGMKIAKNEKNVNYSVLNAALWLHDIAREEESTKGICHAEAGSKIVVPILKKLNFKDSEIMAVSEAIAVHRFSKGKKARFIEAKILQDADRLDALGAVAISRIFSYGGHIGRPVYDKNSFKNKSRDTGIGHFYEKQLKLKPSTFHTKTARKIATKRYSFIKLFLKNFKEEIK